MGASSSRSNAAQLRVIKNGALLPTPFVNIDREESGRLERRRAPRHHPRSELRHQQLPLRLLHGSFLRERHVSQPRESLHRQRGRRHTGQREDPLRGARPVVRISQRGGDSLRLRRQSVHRGGRSQCRRQRSIDEHAQRQAPPDQRRMGRSPTTTRSSRRRRARIAPSGHWASAIPTGSACSRARARFSSTMSETGHSKRSTKASRAATMDGI